MLLTLGFRSAIRDPVPSASAYQPPRGDRENHRELLVR